jgi:hypothetical protein
MAKKKSEPSQPAKQGGRVAVSLDNLESTFNPNIFTTWVDRAELSLRADTDLVYLKFETAVPNAGVRQEVCRLCMNRKHAESLIDIMSKHLDYHPKK